MKLELQQEQEGGVVGELTEIEPAAGAAALLRPDRSRELVRSVRVVEMGTQPHEVAADWENWADHLIVVLGEQAKRASSEISANVDEDLSPGAS